MFESASAPQDPPAADEAPDPDVLAGQHELRVLERIVELAMKHIEALAPGEPADDKGRSPIEALAQASRVVRLSISLSSRTRRELRDLRAGIVRETEEARVLTAERRAAAATKGAERRRRLVSESVLDVVFNESESESEFENLWEALDERLDHDEAYANCDVRPLRESVERLCHDLKLTPDWSRWTGEGWIEDEPPTRTRYSPFNQPSRTRLRDENGKPFPEPAAPAPDGPVLDAGVVRGDETERAPAAETPAEPSFKDALRARVFDVIDMQAESEEACTKLREALDARLARHEPYMEGGIPLRNAVLRLSTALRLDPDWRRWQGEDWVRPLVRLREAHDLE